MWRSILVVSVLSAACSFEPAGTQPGELDATVDTAPAIDAGPSVAPPQAYWSFDTDARDQVGPHHGTLIGTAQISAGASGYRGEALRLATEGDRVDVDLPSALDFNRDFTWHLYVRTTDGSGALLSRNPAGRAWNQGSKAMFVRSDTVQWDSGWVSNPQTQVEIDDGTWHQVIATYVAATDSLDGSWTRRWAPSPASTPARTTSTSTTSTPTSTTVGSPTPGSRSARPTSPVGCRISAR